MKTRPIAHSFSCLILGLSATLIAQDTTTRPDQQVAVELESIGPIGFAPDDTLLVSDPKAAMIHAFNVADLAGKGIGPDDKVEKINEKIASLLGTAPNRIQIVDLAANPKTQQVYVAVTRGRGPLAKPVLLVVSGDGKIKQVSLTRRRLTTARIENAPKATPQDAASGRRGRGRGRNRRMESITDLAWVDGNVVVAGLSNEEFSSKLRVLEYPFKKADAGTSVEIFHGAHGRFETRSPVRTFIPYKLDDKMHIVAAYQCTPLVIFPLGNLGPGKKVKGTTIAELGNRNRPLDMIVYKAKGRDYLLMANSSRGVMKVPTEGMADQKGIVDRVGVSGVQYETIENLKGIVQLDKLDARHAVVLVQAASGEMTLEVVPLP